MDCPALQWKVLGSADRRIVSLVLALQSASEDLGCVQHTRLLYTKRTTENIEFDLGKNQQA